MQGRVPTPSRDNYLYFHAFIRDNWSSNKLVFLFALGATVWEILDTPTVELDKNTSYVSSEDSNLIKAVVTTIKCQIFFYKIGNF